MSSNNLIRDFKIAMQQGKQFTINTMSNVSEFTCYMKENSSTLKIRTISGNERYTSFKNLERYFNNEPILDEKNYVTAICEWLINVDLKENINFNIEEMKKTLKLFIKNYHQFLENGQNGDYYNIFMEANIAGQEIRHSKYLVNLLQKDGNHFHDNLFFRSLLEELKENEFLVNKEAVANFNIANYYVVAEEYDKENEEKKGYMDIVIKDNDYMIIIENKTGTKDHSGQLIRYKDYAQNKKERGEIKDYIVLYLTPFGENPTDEDAQNDENIISISYIHNIRKALLKAKSFIKNDLLSLVIQQYIDSIPLYAFKLPSYWKYELDTLDVLTNDFNTFKRCESIVNFVNNNLMENNTNFSKEEKEIADWLAKYFIKSKSIIERDFMLKLSDELDDALQKEGFYFSTHSNILVNDFPDDNDIDLYYDINTIYESRNLRQKSFLKNQSDEYYEQLRDITKSCLVYENIQSYNESIFLFIQNDLSGFHISIYSLKDNIFSLIDDPQYLLNQDSDIFASNNMVKFLDDKYLEKIIKKCKQNILVELMEIKC